MSQEALPQEVIFTLPSSLVPHRTYEYRANPSNANLFSTEGATIQFTLPRLDRSFFQTNTIYVRGRLALTLAGTASTSIIDPNLSFTSAGAYALFSRQVVRTGSGQAIETIQNPGIITNIQMSYGLTQAERVSQSMFNKAAPCATNDPSGNLSALWGAQSSSAGWAMGVSTINGHNATCDFAIPLNSILTNCDKFLPAGFDEFVIELTIAQMLSSAGVQNPTFIIHKDVAGISAFSLTDLEICAQVFELSPPVYSQLMSQYPQGISLKSQSYMYGSGSLPAQAGAGTYDIVYSHKLQSIKQFVMAVSPTNAIEGPLYSGVNPNLNTYNLSINGQTYPQRPVRMVNPAESYLQIMKSFGALMSDLKCGSIPPEFHAVCSTSTYGNSNFHEDYLTYGANGARDLADMCVLSNRHFILLDLESINGGKPIYNGLATSGSGTSSVIRLEVGSALANVVHNVHYFSVYDALIKFDPVLGVSAVN
jgi:hypothetical protein